MNLDDILSASSDAPTTVVPRSATTETPASAPVVITHETAATTYLALAEYYDARRDTAIESVAKVAHAYGQEMQKRGSGMTSAVATPLLAEMRRFLDAAEQMNHKADRNRALHIDAR